MNSGAAVRSTWTSVWIPLGAVLFLTALAVSALVVPELRLLHVLQALIYVAVLGLARPGNVWGLGGGATIAIAWNSLNLFVTHLMQAGAFAFRDFIQTGQLRRVDTMMVTLGGIGHFVLIVACIGAVREQETTKKYWKFLGGGG